MKVFNSLQTRIIFMATLAVFVGIGVNASINIPVFCANYAKAIQNKTLIIGKHLKNDLEGALRLGFTLERVPNFEDKCEEFIKQDKDLAYITVLDTSARVLYRSYRSQAGDQLKSPADLRSVETQANTVRLGRRENNKKYYDVIFPVFDAQNKHAGVIIVGFPEEVVGSKISRVILFTVVRSLLVFLFTVCAFIFVLNKWVAVPLRRMFKITNDIAAGDLSKRINVNSQDEIGEVAASFNAMAEKLEHYVVELEKARDNLSVEVDNKTKEISLEKDKLQQINLGLSQERLAILNMLEDMNEVNSNLKTAQAQLVQSAKMASIGQLAAGLAHEINNPLTGVLNNVQLIKMIMEERGVSFISEAEFKELIVIIEESAARCKNITQSLLDFSHAPKTYTQNLVINELVTKVSNIVGYELRLQNISIDMQLQPGLPPVHGNPQLLQQVFMNLITNARWAIKKKSPQQGGVVRVKTESGAKNNHVSVYVADDGIGMSPEVLNRIFEPFFTTKDVGEGTGLGLSVIYGIIKEHNGQIEVESKEGTGTTFKIHLPVAGI